MTALPPSANANTPAFPHYRIAQDHVARTQRLIELKIRQFETAKIENVKAHDLADLIKATQTEVKVGKYLDTRG